MHNTTAAGRRHRLIGVCRCQDGWGRAVALWSLEWWAAGGAMLSTSYRQGICNCNRSSSTYLFPQAIIAEITKCHVKVDSCVIPSPVCMYSDVSSLCYFAIMEKILTSTEHTGLPFRCMNSYFSGRNGHKMRQRPVLCLATKDLILENYLTASN